MLLLSCIVLQLRRHGDVLSEGVGAGGQPEPHAAEADGRARLHRGSPDRLPPNTGQLGGPAVPETIRCCKTEPFIMLSCIQTMLIFVLCAVFLA